MAAEFVRQRSQPDQDCLCRSLSRTGRIVEAIGIYQQNAAAGDHGALRSAMNVAVQTGRWTAVREWIEQRIDTGDATRKVFAVTADTHMPDYATPTLPITAHAPPHYPVLDAPQRSRAWLDTELLTLANCLDHATAHPDLVVALAATVHNHLRTIGAWDQANPHPHQRVDVR